VSACVVWKYEIPAPTNTGRSYVDLPETAQPLGVGLQGDVMVLWALIDLGDKAAPRGPRRLIVCNTGQEVPGWPFGTRFLGTITHPSGVVWHVFDGDARVAV
jgi:hypothetical protein